MTPEEIREAISGTFRSAESIWGANSPFEPDTTWIGYALEGEQVDHMDGIVGSKSTSFAPADPDHAALKDLVRDLLPQDGRDVFDAGYDSETIYVNPPTPGWTPSAWVITLAKDPADGDREFTLLTGACGASVV